jgi:hypothetical protein
MTISTILRLRRLIAEGPQTVHWTVVRTALLGWDYDENAGLVSYDMNVVHVTDKGRAAIAALDSNVPF